MSEQFYYQNLNWLTLELKKIKKFRMMISLIITYSLTLSEDKETPFLKTEIMSEIEKVDDLIVSSDNNPYSDDLNKF